MPIRAVSCFAHLTDRYATWTDPHYCVKKFKDAIKGERINQWAEIPVLKGPRKRLSQANADDAVKWFGEMGADLIAKEGIRRPVLVPFPSSKCDVTVRVSKTKRLADAIAGEYPGSIVSDVLRFDKEQHSASKEGGSREPEEVYEHLHLIDTLEKGRPYILVDDVLTSGGHARAAVAFLKAKGVDVVLIVTAVSADKEPNPNPFERVYRELPEFKPN